MYVNSKNGRYEYRKGLEKFDNEIIEFKGTFNKIEKRGCRKIALVNNIYKDNEFICCHCLCDMISNVTKKMFKENANLVSELNGDTQEIINGDKTVKDFNYTKIVENNFKKINKKLYESGKKAQFYSALTNPSTRFVNNITYIIIGITGIVLIKKGQTDLGILTSFLMYVNVFARPFNEITGVMSEIQTASSSYNKIKEVLRCG